MLCVKRMKVLFINNPFQTAQSGFCRLPTHFSKMHAIFRWTVMDKELISSTHFRRSSNQLSSRSPDSKHFHLSQCHQLPLSSPSSPGDPYVKIYLLYNGQRIAKKKTHVKKRTLNPVYNESFVFEVPADEDLRNMSVEFLVLDWDRVTKNEVIGRLELGLNEGEMASKHWMEVINSPRKQIADWHKLSAWFSARCDPKRRIMNGWNHCDVILAALCVLSLSPLVPWHCRARSIVLAEMNRGDIYDLFNRRVLICGVFPWRPFHAACCVFILCFSNKQKSLVGALDPWKSLKSAWNLAPWKRWKK